jgi:hypothetical protein
VVVTPVAPASTNTEQRQQQQQQQSRIVMAPNVQRIRLLATPLASAVRSAVVAKNYVARTTTTIASTEAYWMWETPVDLFSVDRITKNLLLDVQQRKSQQQQQQQSSYNPANDQYWAGQQQRTEHGFTEQPQVQPPLLSYWDEASYGKNNISARYWSEKTFPARRYDDFASPVRSWDENHDALQQWSDRYWHNAGGASKAKSVYDYYWLWTNASAAPACE